MSAGCTACLLSRSPSAGEDRAESGIAAVRAEGGGLEGGSSSEAVVEVTECDDEDKKSKMELEAEFVRDQMNQHEQVRISLDTRERVDEEDRANAACGDQN